MDFEREYNSKEHCSALIKNINTLLDKLGREIRFMEVCGTHTASLFQSGLRSLLPSSLYHISGPGCPVCVTHEDEVETFLKLAQLDNTIIATFGDLIRVPNNAGVSLKNANFGKNSFFEIVYSPQDSLAIAQKNPNHQVVFLGIGFETTAPIIAATILTAKAQGIENFSVYSMHKRVAPALHALLTEENDNKNISKEIDEIKDIDIFLLPGHVACVTGVEYFNFIADSYKKPGIIAGFEASDMAYALQLALIQLVENKAEVQNAYTRVVKNEGNTKAMKMLSTVFDVKPALWRGLGNIDESGLVINDEYKKFNTLDRFGIQQEKSTIKTACKCGAVLKGHIQPTACHLFAKACTPQKPLGPCMVSTEGSCASYYRYMGI